MSPSTHTDRPSGALVLTRRDIKALLSMKECVAAVETAFRLLGRGSLQTPGVMGLHVANGGFHVKAGILPFEGRLFYAAKVNANFPANRTLHDLPTIQGAVLLFDADRGTTLAVMDSIEITAVRTGAATAVAAKYLARQDSTTATLIGCGVQAEFQLDALLTVLPIRRVFAFDVIASRAVEFALTASKKYEIDVTPVATFAQGTLSSDVIVTCTTSHSAFLGPQHVRAGSFIAAVGADSEEKQELEPALLAGSQVVADIAQQAVAIGELHHAIAAGALTHDSACTELGAVVAGNAQRRANEHTIVVFDSTGMALQDVAAACAVYRNAQTIPEPCRIALNT